jgi:hypothetical protein
MPVKIVFAKQLFGAGKKHILSPFADNRLHGGNTLLISRNVVCLLSATGFAEGCPSCLARACETMFQLQLPESVPLPSVL